MIMIIVNRLIFDEDNLDKLLFFSIFYNICKISYESFILEDKRILWDKESILFV